MSLEQKIGQLMIWSFPQTEFTPEFQEALNKYQPGGLIVFRRNIKNPAQIGTLNFKLQRYAREKLKAPLFMLIDQEGGWVTRIRTPTPAPSAMALARMEDNKFIESYGRATGNVLSSLGFNMNLAPVLDISDPDEESFIGNRAFGSEPEIVAQTASAYATGLNAAGVLPTGKHFPGHGGTLSDSHRTVPKKDSSLEELRARDLIPFGSFAKLDFTRAIMTGHLVLSKADPSKLPATYSKFLIEDQLRRSIGFDGLIITDDLEMNGAAVDGDVGERAVRAFLAGNDLLILAGSSLHQHRAFEALLKAVRERRISRERLDQSVARILKAKRRLSLSTRSLNMPAVTSALKALDRLSKIVLKRNFKAAIDASNAVWPPLGKKTHVRIFSASYLFFQKFKNHFQGSTSFYALNPKTLEQAKDDLAKTKAGFSIFFASGNKTANWLNHLPTELKSKLIVINCNHPGQIRSQDTFITVLNINSYFTDSGTWLADLLNEAGGLRRPTSATQ